MIARIIHMPGEEHLEAQRNLSWRRSDELGAEDMARLEAHLAVCGECRADAEAENRMRGMRPTSPLDVESGWRRIAHDLSPRRKTWTVPAIPNWQGWAIAAQLLVILGLVAALLVPRERTAPYQALSAPSDTSAANLVVIFKSEATEGGVRQLLQQARARMVDGPNVAGAYMLRVPAERRDAVAASLRRRSEIVLAEPIDAGTAP